ncbi:MAG: response regulator transcription factor [Luteolibacter sp.]
MNARILMVEDEADLAEITADLLRAEDYEVEIAADGDAGLHLAGSGTFDLVLLDVMLPGKSGYDVCRELRKAGFDGAILMLTARGQLMDRVNGLKLGADDYQVKPFSPEELLARIEALLRRSGKASRTPVSRIRFGEVEVDFQSGTVTKHGEVLALTAKEMELLRVLVNHRGRVIPREEILERVWKDQPFITPRTVDVHISWLRHKVEENPQSPRHLRTVRGEGYTFQP